MEGAPAGSGDGIVCGDFAFRGLGPARTGAIGGEKVTELDLTCSPKADKENRGHRCRVLIATVPDPLQSANLLEFDRNLAALQEAVSTAGYDFESMYTPWNLADLEEPKDPKGSREAMHYRRLFGDEPGAMLFHGRPALNNPSEPTAPSQTSRMGSELLMLLLVPESPTYGLNMHAALEALSAIGQLRSTFNFSTDFSPSSSDGIFWIGPNYSASAAGLYHLAKVKESQPFYAVSGSITSEHAIYLLKAIRNLKANRSPSVEATEEVTTAPSDKVSLEYLLNSGLIGESETAPVAILQENESAYGAEDIHPERSKDGPEVRTFRYPRGISHVRGLFGKQLTNFKPQNAEAPTAQDSKSLFDFTDALQQPLDSPPEFAAQSPYSNEGVLAAIATSVEHIGAKGIVILATDPLDQLFLARYFHQKVPNARVVLLSAERLLPELRGQYDLDGTLSVSRFPLFDDAFLYAPAAGQSRHSLSFMNSTQEGIFLAALQQIAPLQVFEDEKSHTLEKLSLWIGVSSHGSYWPVRRAPSVTPAGEHSLKNSYAITNIPEDPLPKLWLIATSLALMCAVVHVFLFLAGGPFHTRLSKSEVPWVRGLSRHRILTFYLADNSDARDPSEWRRELGRQYWLLSASTQMVLVLAWLILPAILFVSSHARDAGLLHRLAAFLRATDSRVSPFGVLSLGVLLVACVPCVWLVCSFYMRRRKVAIRMRPWRFVWLPLLSLQWLGFNLFVLCHELADESVGSLFALRCVHLASGASPVLPLLLASAGLLTAAAVNLNALTLARDRDPQLPRLPLGLGVDATTMNLCNKRLTDHIECWGFLPPPEGLLLLLCVLIACAVLHPFLLFTSIDGKWMTMLYGFTFITALWTIAWLWVRFIAIWRLLRFLLELLEGSTMRFAFSRLPKAFSLAPIWSYAGLRRTLILPMRWFEYRKVAPQAVTQEQNADQIRVQAELIDKIVSGLGSDEMLLDRVYVRFSEEQNRYATLLANDTVIRASWKRGGPDVDTDRSSNVSKDSGKEAKHISSLCRDDLPVPCGSTIRFPCVVATGNEYIAMRFGAYVRYVTLQLKNLMTFMSMGLFLLLVAAVSYPFQEPQSIAWSLIVIVVILLFGIGTVLLQMDRDAILSRMSETPPGEVKRGAFLLHMLSVGGLPILTALAAVFPSMGNVLFSWIQPMLTALH